MRINYSLNADNTIKTWWRIPFDESKPSIIVADDLTIYTGIDKVVNGEFIRDEAAVEAYLEERREQQCKITRIAELKKLLADSDYQCLKHADGELTDEEYAVIKAQRHAWREEIRELEKE